MVGRLNAPYGVSRKRFGEDLERDLTLELGVGGLIDLTHPALADEGSHVVMAEPGADVQGHGTNRFSSSCQLRTTMSCDRSGESVVSLIMRNRRPSGEISYGRARAPPLGPPL